MQITILRSTDAGVAQLVERQLPKLNVASSNLVFRSIKNHPESYDSGFLGYVMADIEIKCPHCGTKCKWNDNPSRPFCSDRCRLIDLGCWASEEYSVDGGKAPQPEDY